MNDRLRLSDLAADLRDAARGLARAPGFTAACAATLGVGLGFTVLILALLNAVLVRPLPFPEPGRLVTVENAIPTAGVASFPLSPPELSAYGADPALFERLAGYTPASYNLGGVEEPVRVAGAAVTHDFFAALGVTPLRGRLPEPRERGAGGDGPAVVLAEPLWRDALGSDPDAVGRTLLLDGLAHRVAAVIPEGLGFPREARLWTLLDLDPALMGPEGLGRQSLRAVARLAPGVSLAEARPRVAGLAAGFHGVHADFYGEDTAWRVSLTPLAEVLQAGLGAPLGLLTAGVLLLLGTAVANVAGVQIARGIGQERQRAVRMALGAGRGPLTRVVVAEGLLLAGLGGVAGVVLARVALTALPALGPAELGRFSVRLDAAVLGSALLAALVAGAAASLAPALRAASTEPAALLRNGRGGRGPGRLRAALLTGQVALTFLLLSGSLLLVRTFVAVSRVDPGFEPAGALTARVLLPASAVPDPAASVRDLLARVAGLPGVEAAGAVSALPLSGRDSRAAFYLEEGAVERAPGTTSLHFRLATPGYREALGMHLLAGRWLEDGDHAGAPLVAVVNRSLAQRVWPGRDPLGRRIGFGTDGPWIAVVGVVDDVRHHALDAAPVLEAFLPHAQAPVGSAREVALVLRTAGAPASLAGALRAEAGTVVPGQPLYDVRTLDAVVRASLGGRRLNAGLPGIFALLAVGLAMLAVYGTVAAAARARIPELGTRAALGATPARIAREVLSLGVRPGLIGVLAGGAALPVAAGTLSRFLYGVEALSPGTHALAAVGLVAAAALASLGVALQAARRSPAEAMRGP